jgi:glycosyltransferase involved in cell wall biosynthesis
MWAIRRSPSGAGAAAPPTGESPAELRLADLAVIILTFNEARHIERAIRSIMGIAREIVVVDSYSTDGTVEIAQGLGARTLQNPFVTQAQQFQWAIENSGVTSAWIMRLDADELVHRDLAAEIDARLPQLPAQVTGVNLNRRHIFMGRWIRHGGRYPLYLLRIWRPGAAQVEDRWMDEHIVLLRGRAVTFRGGFSDCNVHDLTFFTDKHNKYATREAIEVIRRRLGRAESGGGATLPIQTSFKRWLKHGLYSAIPFHLSSLFYFLYRYLLLGGFLDGREGLIYHFLQGYWYRFLVGAKVMELERVLTPISDPEEALAELWRLTGYGLPPPAVQGASR